MHSDRINLLVNEAVNRFFNGETLNAAIIDIADREDLNPQMLQRVIEKTNEQTLLKKVSMGDTQNFDMADPEKIFLELNKPSEQVKTAETTGVTVFSYSSGIEKTATTQTPAITDSELKMVIHSTLSKLAEEKDHYVTKCNDIIARISKDIYEDDLEKIASFIDSKIADQSEYGDIARKFSGYYEEAKKRDRLINYMSKNAGFWSAALKTGLETIGGPAKAIGSTVLGVGKVLKPIGKAMATKMKPVYKFSENFSADAASAALRNKGFGEKAVTKMLRDNSALAEHLPDMVTQTGKVRKFAAGRAMTSVFVGNSLYGAGKKAINKPKFATNLQKIGSEWSPLKTVGVVGASLLGGVATDLVAEEIRNSIKKKRLAKALTEILAENPELGGENEVATRRNFKSISIHAPSIASDPVAVAPVLKQFQVFGGPDYRTIQDLRLTEAKGGPQPQSVFASTAPILSTLASASKLSKSASLHGVASSRVKTYFGDSPESIATTKRREIIDSVRGKTIGGAVSGALIGAMTMRSRLPLKAKLLITGSSALLGAMAGGKIGETVGGYGSTTSTPVSFNAPRSEILQAAIRNIRKRPGANVYEHDVKRNIYFGI